MCLDISPCTAAVIAGTCGATKSSPASAAVAKSCNEIVASPSSCNRAPATVA